MKHGHSRHTSNELEIGEVVLVAQAGVGVDLQSVVVPVGTKPQRRSVRLFDQAQNEPELLMSGLPAWPQVHIILELMVANMEVLRLEPFLSAVTASGMMLITNHIFCHLSS